MSLGASLMSCWLASMALAGGAFAGWRVHLRTGVSEWIALPVGAIAGAALFAAVFEILSRLSKRRF